MNVEYINPFIEASQSVLKSVANMDITLGKLHIKTSPYASDTLAIIIGLTGKLRGQVIFSMSKEIACQIASAMMMGMPVNELDEISKSAVTEATNMILGNTATILYNRGIPIDITPPSLLIGDNMQISTNKMKTVCVPLKLSSGGTIDLDIAVME
ncbi:chemotaxis protein CheX [Petroclostridium sp. X23]|uniref:chemotaxis protein CheX n=1 Tax=Petroclostridium sp. X23 TaxID=3045146 RepID=UPI0024AD0DFC|nr:chemotaxis protein CheX [Petroclostridium sp. X23]WHH60719.1 chemotaxis protein CheX [Petroclostridium sp. X23]